MRKSTLLKAFCLLVAFAAFGWLSPLAFAQRGGGGHGGGGGFHGGSAGGFHGGGSYHGGGGHYSYTSGHFYGGYGGTGWHGGYNGWHAGYYGWRGGYWGYPGYGYGWGFGLGFGWPYGWGYPYAYGYSPWWYAPYSYYYPYSCPPGYSCPYNGNDDPPPTDPAPAPNQNGPARLVRPPVPGGTTTNTANSDGASLGPHARVLSVDRITATPVQYRLTPSKTQLNPKLRPEVQNAIRALREMPPYVRQREIETGRYSHFSASEKEFLKSLDYP